MVHLINGVRTLAARQVSGVTRGWRRLRQRAEPVAVPSAGPRVSVNLTGSVLVGGPGQPIFAARVQHPASRVAVRTDPTGQFSLFLPDLIAGKEEYVVLLSRNYWPKTVSFRVPVSPPDPAPVALGPQPLTSFPRFLTDTWWGEGLALFGPRLIHWWHASTPRERMLALVVVLFLLLPASLFAIDWGLPLPWTDADETVREHLQRTGWFPSARRVIRYSTIRSRYYEGIVYEIAPGEHVISSEGVLIDRGSEVRIDRGTTLKMDKDAQVLVRGTLIADGDAQRPVQFLRASPTEAWGNITFAGESSAHSRLNHCVIDGGSGRGVTASDSGYFDLAGTTRVGGGLLLFDTTISISETQVRHCGAVFGGGIYLRNPPAGTSGAIRRAGSRFHRLTVDNCVAEGSVRSAGGAAFVKDVYPEFKECMFSHNQVHGAYASGGAVYAGEGSQLLFEDCSFSGNKAEAEGGALYAFRARDHDDENRGGVVIRHGDMAENQSNGSGGAISAFNSRLHLSRVAFKNNAVGFYRYDNPARDASIGGAVFLHFDGRYKPLSPVVVEQCTFLSNKVHVPNAVDGDHERWFVGGALCILADARLRVRLAALEFNSNIAYKGAHVALPATSCLDGWSNWDPETRFTAPAWSAGAEADAAGTATYTFPGPRIPGVVMGDKLHIDTAVIPGRHAYR